MKAGADSIARGGTSVVAGRLLGMVFSFFLFLVLARHSPVEAGVFRTVVTYIVIAESLGMLGLHRWLATEIAPGSDRRWKLFVATCAFTLIVSIFLTLAYFGVAALGFYSNYLSAALMIGALAVIPSGIFAAVQSALVGIGRSHSMGRLNMIESITRCSVALLLVWADCPVNTIVWTFVITRWVVAGIGVRELAQVLHADGWKPDLRLTRSVAAAAPQFASIIVGFMLLRNAGLLLLPALTNEAEAAVYTVTYQLFDLLLLIPSVLALTSNNLFVNRADTSVVALKRASVQLLSVTALAFFPCLAVVAGFAAHIIALLYGHRYEAAAGSLMLLMLAAGATMVDQVLSQIMVARRDYRADLIANAVGGSAAVVLSLLLCRSLGATGAAIGLALAVALMVAVRLVLLRDVIGTKLIALATWRPTVAAGITFVVCVAAFRVDAFAPFTASRFVWLSAIPLALALYAATVHLTGGFSLSKRTRMQRFLFRH